MPKRRGQPARRVPRVRFRHVLFADDGSKGAARARDFALTLVAATGARLTAVYVRGPLEKPEQAQQRLAATRAAAALAGRRCETVIGLPVGITNAGRRILAAAKRQKVDVIVVGARGAGVARRLLGSVSSYVVSRAGVSVCVVR